MEGGMRCPQLEGCRVEHRGQNHIPSGHDLYRILGYYDENEDNLNPISGDDNASPRGRAGPIRPSLAEVHLSQRWILRAKPVESLWTKIPRRHINTNEKDCRQTALTSHAVTTMERTEARGFQGSIRKEPEETESIRTSWIWHQRSASRRLST